MTLDLLVLIPVLLPMLAASISVVAWRSPLAQRVIGVGATGGLLAASIWLLVATWREGIITMEMSGFPAPFGIVLVSDLLSAMMVLMVGIMGFTVVLYSLATAGEDYERFGYYPLMHLLHAGVAGAFLTGDIFNLYVWFEVMLVASFALLILGGKRPQMEGAVKYVTINLVSSMILLTAIGLTYGLTGTLNMAHIAATFQEVDSPMVTVVAMMYMVAFGIKAGSFPLFFWLPASYHTPPVAVSALFAGLLTKVGAYALFRVFTLIFTQDVGFTHNILLWAGAITMLTGVLGAAAQFEFRRILSIHIISQIGYMLMALGLLASPDIPDEVAQLAIAGGIFYIIHNIIVKTNLFLVSGVVYRLLGSYQLKELGGIYRAKPFLAFLFFVPALSLAGLPPLSGFFAKFAVIRAGLEAYQGVVVAFALVTGALTLYSMVKIWMYAFWTPLDDDHPRKHRLSEPNDSQMWVMYTPIILLLICTVVLGVYSEPFFELTLASAAELLDPSQYIEAVGIADEISHPIEELPASGGAE